MKKIFAVILSVILLFSCNVATADVLSGDWQAASDDELAAAVSAIYAELAARKAASAPAGDTIALTGSGTAINSVEIPFKPARVTIQGTGNVNGKISGGTRDLSLNGYRTGQAQDVFNETGTFTLLVEADADWVFTVEPIAVGGAWVDLAGHGSYLSDMFPLDSPKIITVSTDTVTDSLGSFIVELLYLDRAGAWKSDYEYSINGGLVKGEAFSKDLILQMKSENGMYMIRVFSNYNVDWKIEAK